MPPPRNLLRALLSVGFVASTALAWIALTGGEPAGAESMPEISETEVAWDVSTVPGTLMITARPQVPVRVNYRVMLGNLDHRWETSESTTDETGQLNLPLDLPDEAWLDDAAEDYVTDLVATVDVDTERIRLPVMHLAWSNGREQVPDLWSRAMMRTRAPNGVFDAALRARATFPHTRLLPNVGTVPQLPDTGELR